jgi:hypothetical protein
MSDAFWRRSGEVGQIPSNGLNYGRAIDVFSQQRKQIGGDG